MEFQNEIMDYFSWNNDTTKYMLIGFDDSQLQLDPAPSVESSSLQAIGLEDNQLEPTEPGFEQHYPAPSIEPSLSLHEFKTFLGELYKEGLLKPEGLPQGWKIWANQYNLKPKVIASPVRPKKVKKGKKKREPKPCIKKPQNAFMLYRAEQSKKMAFKIKNRAEVKKILEREWKMLSFEEQDLYFKKARLAKRQYEANFPENKRRKGNPRIPTNGTYPEALVQPILHTVMSPNYYQTFQQNNVMSSAAPLETTFYHPAMMVPPPTSPWATANVNPCGGHVQPMNYNPRVMGPPTTPMTTNPWATANVNPYVGYFQPWSYNPRMMGPPTTPTTTNPWASRFY